MRDRYILVALASLGLVICGIRILQRQHHSHDVQTITRTPVAVAASHVDTPPVFPSTELIAFWDALLDALKLAKPTIEKVHVHGKVSEDYISWDRKPDVDTPLPDLTEMSDDEIEALKQSHDTFLNAVAGLSKLLPHKKGSRGIVMTAGGPYLGTAIMSIMMLRQTGSKLPVELFLDTDEDAHPHICNELLPSMNARCRILESVWKGGRTRPELKKYQYKVFAILLSDFEQLLFLDADNFPVLDPEQLFDAKPFTNHGLVTWPDYWWWTMSPLWFNVTGLAQPALLDLKTSESSTLMYHKGKHAEDLLLATYYNYYGPELYYTLLTQGGPGEGDKETFLQAARVLQKPAYDVKTNVSHLGRWEAEGKLQSMGMKQADPVEDYKLYKNVPPGVGVTSYWSASGQTGPPPRARPFFIHHNIFKVNLFDTQLISNEATKLNDKSKMTRWWGDESTLTETSGYDVERAMWDQIIKFHCEGQLWSGFCELVNEYYKIVFLGGASRFKAEWVETL